MTPVPQRVEERGPVRGRVVVRPDLVEDLEGVPLAWRELSGGIFGVQPERRGERAHQVFAETRPVPGVTEGVRQLDVVDELVAVDPGLG